MKETFVLNDRLSYSSLEDMGREMGLYLDVFVYAFQDFSFRRFLREKGQERGEKAVRIFDLLEDKEEAIFKASYILNPGHHLCFGGKGFDSLKDLGYSILSLAPKADERLTPLLKKRLLGWYLSFKGEDKMNSALMGRLKELETTSDTLPKQAWFDLGFLLAKEKRFFFEGKTYNSLKEFLLTVGGDERIMSSYDFLTMPYMESYCKVVHLSSLYSLAKNLAEDSHRKYVELEKLK